MIASEETTGVHHARRVFLVGKQVEAESLTFKEPQMVMHVFTLQSELVVALWHIKTKNAAKTNSFYKDCNTVAA